VTKQTKLRTTQITPNDNKSFSIGTALMVDDWYEKLGLNEIVGRHKSKGITLDALIRGMLLYQLGDNFSALQDSEWMNRERSESISRSKRSTLRRCTEQWNCWDGTGKRSIREFQDNVLELLSRPKTDVLLD